MEPGKDLRSRKWRPEVRGEFQHSNIPTFPRKAIAKVDKDSLKFARLYQCRDGPMHEMSIAQSVLDIIIQESQNHKVNRVLSVAVKVGELSAVETESLRFCFDFLSKGTLAEGARLEIERVQVTCHCQECGSNFTVQELIFTCPACKSPKVEMLSGRELSVDSFEAE